MLLAASTEYETFNLAEQIGLAASSKRKQQDLEVCFSMRPLLPESDTLDKQAEIGLFPKLLADQIRNHLESMANNVERVTGMRAGISGTFAALDAVLLANLEPKLYRSPSRSMARAGTLMPDGLVASAEDRRPVLKSTEL